MTKVALAGSGPKKLKPFRRVRIVLSKFDLNACVNHIAVTSKEITKLYKRFRRLDRDGSGTIDRGDLLRIPELAMNPLVDRIISIFHTKEDEELNFKEFIDVLSVFSAREDPKTKLQSMNSLLSFALTLS